MEQRKTPVIAILLSLIISGAGQIYNGEIGKGITMIVACIFCWAASPLVFPIFILIALWIWGMVDANTKAKEFNEALKIRLNSEDLSQREAAEQQAMTVTSQEFVTQIEKFFKLFQNGLLSEAEFEAKKKEAITILSVKKLRETPEDFLTSIIPLIQKKILTEHEITQIKGAVL